MRMRYCVSTSIESLLSFNDRKLGNICSGDGAIIRIELQNKMAAGELRIGSEGCDGFDPVKGCPGHEIKE